MKIFISKDLTSGFLKDFQEIFFRTASVQNFESNKERQSFFNRWAGYYLENHSEDVHLARNENNKLMGYLTGCRDTKKALEFLKRESECHLLFQHQFERFPAHFHMNVHPDFQGQGVGRQLLEIFCKEMQWIASNGVHLVTTEESDNVNFYLKTGFSKVETQICDSTPVVCLGREFS